MCNAVLSSTDIEASMSDVQCSHKCKVWLQLNLSSTTAKQHTLTFSPGPLVKLGSAGVMQVAMTCSLYQSCLKTLAQLRMEILSGLCHQNALVTDIWRLLLSMGPNCGLKAFMDHLSANPKATAPEFQVIHL